MTDKELISEIAKVWVAGGGDRDGFYFCVGDIGIAITQEIEHQEDELYWQERKDTDQG